MGVSARIARCRSQHRGPCSRYDATKSGLWRCPACHRLFCMNEGGSDSAVCDTCWGNSRLRKKYAWE